MSYTNNYRLFANTTTSLSALLDHQDQIVRYICSDRMRHILTKNDLQPTQLRAIVPDGIFHLIDGLRRKSEVYSQSMRKVSLNFTLCDEVGPTHILATLEPTANGTLLTLADATLQRQQELANLLQQMTRSVHTLTTALAHETNNLLTALFNNTEYARQVIAEKGALCADLESTFEDIQAGLRNVHLAIVHSRGHIEGHPQSLGVPEVRHILKLCAFSIRLQSVAQIKENLSSLPGGVRVCCSAPQLYCLFLNLLQNAVQAFDDAFAQSGRAEISLRARYRPDLHKVCIEVQDNGAGISPMYAPFVCDPGFTTSPHVRAGLGLSLCQKIVQEFGESIEVDSTLAVGTRVTFCIPCVVEPL